MSMIEEEQVRTGYMCGTDFLYELGMTPWMKIHSRPKGAACGPHCGVVEVEVRFKRWALKPEGYDDTSTDDNL